MREVCVKLIFELLIKPVIQILVFSSFVHLATEFCKRTQTTASQKFINLLEYFSKDFILIDLLKITNNF